MSGSQTDSSSFSTYVRPMLARWWLIVLIAVITGGGSYLYYHRKTRSYTATTTMLVQQGSTVDQITGQLSAPGDADRYIRDQATLIETPGVAAQAASVLHYSGDPRNLLGSISANPATGSDFLTITGTSADPAQAVRLANGFAQAYIQTLTKSSQQQAAQALAAAGARLNRLPSGPTTDAARATLQQEIQQLQLAQSLPTVNARQVTPAAGASSNTTSPLRAALFAVLIGLVIGGALAYVLEAIDSRLKRLEDLRALHDWPVLAAIPRMDKSARQLSARRGLHAPLTEVFRVLRSTLLLAPAGDAQAPSNGGPHAPRTFLVSSALPKEGKSTVAVNLALAFHESGRSVVIVDADLRRPQVAARFGLPSDRGLTDVLTGTADVSDVLQTPEIDSDAVSSAVRARQAADRSTSARSQPIVPAPAGPRPVTPARSSLLAGRRSNIDQAAPLAAAPGPGSAESAAPPEEAARLAVLASGREPADPAAVLAAGQIGSLLERLKQEFDVVVMDTSPLLAVADAMPLLAEVDAVLLVARLNMTSRPSVDQLADLVGRVPGANIVGLVANAVEETAASYAYSYGYASAAA